MTTWICYLRRFLVARRARMSERKCFGSLELTLIGTTLPPSPGTMSVRVPSRRRGNAPSSTKRCAARRWPPLKPMSSHSRAVTESASLITSLSSSLNSLVAWSGSSPSSMASMSLIVFRSDLLAPSIRALSSLSMLPLVFFTLTTKLWTTVLCGSAGRQCVRYQNCHTPPPLLRPPLAGAYHTSWNEGTAMAGSDGNRSSLANRQCRADKGQNDAAAVASDNGPAKRRRRRPVNGRRVKRPSTTGGGDRYLEDDATRSRYAAGCLRSPRRHHTNCATTAE